MDGLPAARALVDLDCDALNLPDEGQRCDYVYFDDDGDSQRVAPIELKRGRFNGRGVAAQLQGGATIADKWIPRGASFRLTPVLVHGRGIRRLEFTRLRAARVSLRGHKAQAVLIRCGAQLSRALGRGH